MSGNMVEYIKIAPGMVEIKPLIDGILTRECFLEKAKLLLKNGLEVVVDGVKRPKDIDSPGLMEEDALYNEFKKTKTEEVKEVIFTVDSVQYMVNEGNINDIINKIQSEKKVSRPKRRVDDATQTAIDEMFLRD